MKWTKRWRRRQRALLRRSDVERELEEEFAHHLEMETQKNLRAGMDPKEARRQAAIAFGGAERHREEVREARWLGRVVALSPDVKLAIRMLVKNPALTVIGVIGISVAVAIAAGLFQFMDSFYYSAPPLDDGERIVAIENRNVADASDGRAWIYDLHSWRESLRSIEEIGAYRRISQGAEVPGGVSGPARVAEVTASTFRLARVPTLLGRPLLDSDEVDGAPRVVVLGYEEWQRDFGGDPEVIGREIRLGDVVHTVVGVMPRGFRFPVNDGIWTAMSTDRSRHGPGEGSLIRVFGRLAPGVQREAAQAELTAIGERMSAESPAIYEEFAPVVMPYIHPVLDVQEFPAYYPWLLQFIGVLLLTVIAVNVAVLVYARTATRRAELTVRAALGAGRLRILTQLFVEALVLSGIGAMLGLAVAQFGYGRLGAMMDGGSNLPYWIPENLSLATILYAAVLAIFAAIIVGVLPALQATGSQLQSSLRQIGGATGVRMGTTWTILIVAQVAVAVAVLPVAVAVGWNALVPQVPTPTFAADEVLAIDLVAQQGNPRSEDAGSGQPNAAYAAAESELMRRIEADSDVLGVTYALNVPGSEPIVRLEVDAATGALTSSETFAAVGRVDPDFFEVFGVPTLAGRTFGPGDLTDDPAAVIVNRSFVNQFINGDDPLGRRVRPSGEPNTDSDDGPWYEIVGVVEDMFVDRYQTDQHHPAVYHPLAAGAGPLTIAVRTRGTVPADFPSRVRQIAREVAPGVVPSLARMDVIAEGGEPNARRGIVVVLTLIVLSVLLLSAAGIYALMSFAVTRRRREIGIRTALGSPRGQVIMAILARATRQLAAGLCLGIAVAALLDRVTGGELLSGRGNVALPTVAALMIATGLLATLGPARRGLRVSPFEALRQE